MPWKKLNRVECNTLFVDALKSGDTDFLRRLCREDLYFLLRCGCNRSDMDHDWIFSRCREVEKSPDGFIDLWARFHYKSSIVTFGKTIQDILINPEETIGIFSHTRPIAKAFLAQIKRELEVNTFLKNLFDDILYKEPHKESPSWSLDNGIIVKRKSNPKEATVEAWGLVDGQPTSKHFSILNYDDVVTLESVTTPDQIEKTTNAWAISTNLGSEQCRKRIVGTRYHQQDTYKAIIDRDAATARTYPATDDGTLSGKPVLLDQADFDKRVKALGSYVASCQLLLNPLADNAMGFKLDWLEFWDVIRKRETLNVYILADAANAKKKASDYTAVMVVGLGVDSNYYLLDGIRDRMNLTERTKALFDLVRKWNPKVVGYERYGLMSDVEHIKYVQQQEGYRFRIIELGGSQPKNDRIRRLVPAFENHRFYLPRRLLYTTVENKVVDLTSQLINQEYESFPVGTHDDILDAISRIFDPELEAVFPKKTDALPQAVPVAIEAYNPLKLPEFASV